MTTRTTKARTIAGREITLEAGREYRAGRPMAARGQVLFNVSVTDITGDAGDGVVLVIPALSYDEANAFLAAFNNGETSFAGRTW